MTDKKEKSKLNKAGQIFVWGFLLLLLLSIVINSGEIVGLSVVSLFVGLVLMIIDKVKK